MKFKPGNPSEPKWVNIENGKIYRMPTEKEAFKPQLFAFIVFAFGCIAFWLFTSMASLQTLNIVSKIISPIVIVFFLIVMPLMVMKKSRSGRTQRALDEKPSSVHPK